MYFYYKCENELINVFAFIGYRIVKWVFKIASLSLIFIWYLFLFFFTYIFYILHIFSCIYLNINILLYITRLILKYDLSIYYISYISNTLLDIVLKERRKLPPFWHSVCMYLCKDVLGLVCWAHMSVSVLYLTLSREFANACANNDIEQILRVEYYRSKQPTSSCYSRRVDRLIGDISVLEMTHIDFDCRTSHFGIVCSN